jgi:hypothetical protein
MLKICTVACLYAFLLSSSCLKAGVDTFNYTDIDVIVNGHFYEVPLTVSGTEYTGADGRNGCNNEKYDYKVFGAPTYPIVLNGVTVVIEGVTVSNIHNSDFWKWVYTGYSGGGGTDWTKNCFGYAFGVGDWPVSSSVLKEAGGVRCWFDDMSGATIADNTQHTIKMTMSNCPNSIGVRITSTSEKFKESSIYTLGNGSCFGPPIDLAMGNGLRGGMNNLIPYRK